VRKSLEDTWRFLESVYSGVPRNADGSPAVLDRLPSINDEEPRLSFFRTGMEDADCSHLTMPRTFFGRSWLVRTTFADTDLSGSCMCWNDFDDCDFIGADLSGCDLRASIFRRCTFAGAILRGADLRRSTFDGCEFIGADLSGAVAEGTGSRARLHDLLSAAQVAAVSWVDDAGPEPPGG
jgi:uncharacterized protein YjbI with pentapeptide repeats